jgi:hypothetical protein
MNNSNRPSRLPQAPLSGPHEQLWHAAWSDWDNSKLHEVLLSHCQTPAQLAALAGRYRAQLDDAARKDIAEAQLKRIAAAAMARMDVTTAARKPEPASGGVPWKIVLAFLFVVATVVVLRFL